MDRREFVKTISKASLAAGLFSTFSGCMKQKRPNILMIVTDDQGYADMSCTGLADDVNTPNMDKLAKKGIRFTNAYATSPICSPSRMSLITGVYNQRFGTYWYGGKGIHDKQYKTIPEILKPQGYTNGYVGKVHYGSPKYDSDPSHRNFPLNHGFDYFYGCTSARKHYLHHKTKYVKGLERKKKKYSDNKNWFVSLRQGPMWINRKKKDQEGLSTELFGKQAREFIDRNKKEPFYLQLSFNAVHNFTHQLPEEYLEKHNLEGFYDWEPAKEKYMEWYRKGRKPNNPEGRAHYLGQLYYLDKEIGKVLDFLKENNLEKNTIVILMGDNGGPTPIYANNSPFRGSKYTLYEGGIRVPLLVSWPKKYKDDVVMDNIVSGLDILPTICSATGIKTPDNVDGIDLNPLLKGRNSEMEHQPLIWDTGTQIAVRQGKWKLRIATDNTAQKREMVKLELGEFLYNLKEDPGETTNLAEKYPEKVAELKTIHKEWKKSIESS